MVFYRKYRPQKLSELDSEEVRAALSAILVNKEVPHAFLFAGPKGLGKTSAARIVAKIVNCERKGVEPCNKCEQCQGITNGTNLDILEIDAASNRGIDEIRELREKIRSSPLSASKKVYIVDEAHMLTREAFNALLKTLEEPPPHVIFILCTTEPEKLPETIASRCFVISFKRATEEETIRSLSRIIKQEKMIIDRDALLQIASFSDGSFRDAAKILEQVKIRVGRKKITKEFLEKVNATSNRADYIAKIRNLLQKKKTKEALALVGQIVKEGIEINLFLTKLIEELHEQLLLTVSQTSRNEGFTVDELTRLINLLVKAHQETKFAVIPQLPLELVIIEWEISRVGAEVANDPPTTTQSLAGVASPSLLLKQLIEKIKSYNHSVAGVLRGCKVASFDGKSLIIETNYKFHQERLEEKKTKEFIEQVCRQLTGERISISIKMRG